MSGLPITPTNGKTKNTTNSKIKAMTMPTIQHPQLDFFSGAAGTGAAGAGWVSTGLAGSVVPVCSGGCGLVGFDESATSEVTASAGGTGFAIAGSTAGASTFGSTFSPPLVSSFVSSGIHPPYLIVILYRFIIPHIGIWCIIEKRRAMKTIWDSIVLFYSNWLYPNFYSLIAFLSNNQYAIYILVIFLIVLSIVKRILKKKFNNQTLPKLIDFITAIVIMLLIIVAYTIFSPSLSKFIESDTSTDTSTPTETSPKSTTGTESAPAAKQLYYGGGCYGCYADACPSNGYSYGGYDANLYNYYKSLCQACQCTSSRWQSFWK